MIAWIIAANILAWPVLHIAIARIVLSLPLARFGARPLTRSASHQREARFYRNVLFLQQWKTRLPDGAPWLGGFSKKTFARRERGYIETFILETRRAEFAHWCMLGCFPLFFLWNPPWACGIMTAYAIAANAPCIIAQRYNRIVLSRMLEKMDRNLARYASPAITTGHCGQNTTTGKPQPH
jgi:glycosyl-4,4'-diaponeurosporenoate acyltransferase